MGTDRFERFTRSVTDLGPLTRRKLSGLAAGATAAMALAVDASAKKKKKKKKKRCVKPTCRVACPAGANLCTDNPPWLCGRDCVCYTGTTRTICARRFQPACIACEVDADCDDITGAGSVCFSTSPGCECDGLPKVCVEPCAEPIPIQCS